MQLKPGPVNSCKRKRVTTCGESISGLTTLPDFSPVASSGLAQVPGAQGTLSDGRRFVVQAASSHLWVTAILALPPSPFLHTCITVIGSTQCAQRFACTDRNMCFLYCIETSSCLNLIPASCMWHSVR